VAAQKPGGDFLAGLGTGVYSYRAAADLLQVSSRRIRSWAEGYSYQVLSGPKKAKPVLQRPKPERGILTFNDLVELFWVKAFIEKRVKLGNVRKAAERLATRLNDPYPFASVELKLHGSELIAESFEGLVNPSIGQRVFDVIRPFLEQLEFQPDGSAVWRPASGVVIDPKRSFGEPLVETCGIRTDILYNSYMAEGRKAEPTADWYKVSPADVMTAYHYEVRCRKRAA